jgi:hypothetical protein
LSQHFLYNPLKGQQPLQKPKQNNTKKPAQKQQHIKNKEYQKTSTKATMGNKPEQGGNG